MRAFFPVGVSSMTFAAVFLFSGCWAEDATPLPVEVAPNDPNIRYIGRFDLRNASVPRCAWPASTIVARFRGVALNAKLKASKGEDYFEVVVDGKRHPVLALNEKQTLYSVAAGLPDAEHTVELVKRTEPMTSTVQFLGFQLGKDGKLLPLPSRLERRIEVYGDSVSTGNGIEGANKDAPMTRKVMNSYLAYGAVAARALAAEYVCTAWSGRKMWPDNTLPSIHDETLAPWDGCPKWGFSAWVPQVVIVMLGSNDFENGKAPEEKGWTEAYLAFVKQLRGHYPDGHICCCVCSTIVGKERAVMRKYVGQAVETLRKAGDERVHYFEFNEQDAANGMGAGWHPSVKTQQLMADKLVPEIRKALNW